MTRIDQITSSTVLDSGGVEALVVMVHVGDQVGIFATPSAASPGSHEVLDSSASEGQRQLEKYIPSSLVGMDSEDQQGVDEKLKQLHEEHNLAGDVLIGTSIAVAKVAAMVKNQEPYEYLRTLATISPSQEVPHLFINLINGGAHAEGGGPIQEHWIIPKTQNVRDAYVDAQKVQQNLEELIGDTVTKGDEGGFVLPGTSVSERFSLLAKSAEGLDVMFGSDIAASYFYKDGKYILDEKSYTPEAYLQFMSELVEKHSLSFVEDPFHEEDFDAFAKLRSSKKAIIVGDDLTTTNQSRIEEAVQHKSISAVIIKPNQVGTLSETLEAMQYAREHDIHCIVSHRSGETTDTFIADLAYAFGCLGLKSGAPGQKERDVKYKRLMKIIQ